MKLKYGWTPTSQIPANYTHYKYDELKNKILQKNGKITETPQTETDMFPLKECPFCTHENQKVAWKHFHLCKQSLLFLSSNFPPLLFI